MKRNTPSYIEGKAVYFHITGRLYKQHQPKCRKPYVVIERGQVLSAYREFIDAWREERKNAQEEETAGSQEERKAEEGSG